jgi:hypothetical protein
VKGSVGLAMSRRERACLTEAFVTDCAVLTDRSGVYIVPVRAWLETPRQKIGTDMLQNGALVRLECLAR